MMSTPANNAFAPLLQNIRNEPPRSVKELPELSLKSLLKPWLGFVFGFAALFAFFPVMIFVLSQTDKNTQAARRTLRSTQGIVLQAQPQQFASGNEMVSNSVNIKYSFKAARGEVFYGSQTVQTGSVFALLKPGAKVPISYDPQDPSFNGIAGVLGKNAMPISLFLFFPLFALIFIPTIFGPILFEPIRNNMKARRVFTHGTLTVGQVRFVKQKHNIAKTHLKVATFEIIYDFIDSKDHKTEGRQTSDNDWFVGKLDVGTEITVAYLPDRPEQNICVEAFIS